MDWSALFNNIGNLLKKNTPVTPTVVTPTVVTPTVVTPTIVKEVTKTPVILEPTITVSTQEVTASVTTNIPVIEVSKPKQYIITKEQLKAICPTANVEFVDAINKYTIKYEINTKLRMAAFVSQTLHESGGYNIIRESFNYKPKTLLKVFPKYIKSLEDATKLLAKGASAVGDRIYGGRMGNGINNGDGYHYRGGGILQTTGFLNYSQLSKELGVPELIQKPSLITTPDIAVESAMVFWKKNSLNKIADSGDILTLTKRINNGINGLKERKSFYNKAMKVLT